MFFCLHLPLISYFIALLVSFFMALNKLVCKLLLDIKVSLFAATGQVLEKAGGKEFVQEVKDLFSAHGPLESAGAVICPGHQFPAKFVIHCNVPSGSSEPLEKCVRNCLALADEKNIRVLAVPPLATHSVASQKQQAAQTILKAISNYFVNVMSSSLKQIYFVLSDMESIGIYTSELAKLDS
ncbi:unnamed protein product [Ixodes pacificus]